MREREVKKVRERCVRKREAASLRFYPQDVFIKINKMFCIIIILIITFVDRKYSDAVLPVFGRV